MKIMPTLLFTAFTAVSLLGATGCDDKKDAKDDKKADAKVDEKKEEAKKEEVKEEPKAEANADTGAEGGGGADKIGIPECDEYIEKYIACIDAKMPEATRETTKKAVQQSIDAWKQAAQGPGKDTLAGTCKTALETAKKATEALGCEW